MPKNYKYTKEYVEVTGSATYHIPFDVIKTPLSNIETETIGKPICKTNYIGINGGFFDAANGYDAPPTGGSSIVYNYYDENKYIYVEGKKISANYDYNEGGSGSALKRKTMIIYKDGGSTKAAYRYIKSKSDAFEAFDNITNIIGGNDYNESSWGSIAYYGPAQRTVLAWKDSYAYLINSPRIGIQALKECIEKMGLNPVNSILLDGSGSTCMRVEIDGKIKNLGGDRYLYNIVRLINSN